jgi:hypothetical protein
MKSWNISEDFSGKASLIKTGKDVFNENSFGKDQTPMPVTILKKYGIPAFAGMPLICEFRLFRRLSKFS